MKRPPGAAISMFHVKRLLPKNTSPHVPISLPLDEIGRQTRILVQKSLHAPDFLQAEPRFLDRIERFAAAIALWGSRTNLTAHPDDPSALAFHIIDSLMPLVIGLRPQGQPLKSAFAPGRRILDLGSGGGFPGLILASACEAQFTLFESRRRRASFLAAAVTAMGLANVAVDTRRIEAPALEPVYDAVTARAFAQPRVVYETAAAALKPGGIAILYVNSPQALQSANAAALGLSGPLEIPYEVARGFERVARIVAIWRKS